MTGFEALAAQAISGIAVPIFQSLWQGGGKVLGMFGKTLDEQTKEIIFRASKQYIQKYEKRHGILKVLGMGEDVKLESIYTAVQFLDEQTIRSFESLENLEKVFREGNIRKFQSSSCHKQEGIKVANEKQYLMVLGQPGAGKTTFLIKIGLEALKGKQGRLKHDCIPVLIKLQDFTSKNINIEQEIVKEFRICGFPSPDKFTAKALEQGKLLILLDGLDEVHTKNLNETIKQIQNFVDQYDQNCFIASCRTAAYCSSFRRFNDVVIIDFDNTQIQQFICNWFHSEPDTANKCWEILQQPENAAAKELAQTPLLLTFLCLVYDRSRNFPDNRSVLYRKALRILLEEWAAEKRIQRDEIYQGLHTELEEILLSEIAYKGFETDRLFFTQREIVEQIKNFLASNLNAPQHLDGEAVLNAIAIQQGILVERAEDIFSFSHLTLQEYLTAQYIEDHRQIEKLVTEHLCDQRWKEVFLLVVGLMRSGVDELLLLMEKEAQKYINTPKLQALLRWADQATSDSEGDIKPAGKRAIAINTAIEYTCAYVFTYTHNRYSYDIANVYLYGMTIAYPQGYFDEFCSPIYTDYSGINGIINSIETAKECEKLKIFNTVNFTVLVIQLNELKVPDHKQPFKMHGEFVNCIQQIWLKALNLSPELINLSKEEAKAMSNYFYANSLIIHCKQAAVRVSPITWEAIEQRMLLVADATITQ